MQGFIARCNIERFQHLLRTPLAVVQRRTIETLLAEEVHALRLAHVAESAKGGPRNAAYPPLLTPTPTPLTQPGSRG